MTLSLRKIRCRGPMVSALALSIAFAGIVGSASAQSVPELQQDNPIQLNGDYHGPAGVAGGVAGGGAAFANTSGAAAEVSENSGGVVAQKGTFTPYDDGGVKPTAFSAAMRGQAMQAELDLNAMDVPSANNSGRGDHTFQQPGAVAGSQYSPINWQNETFAIGVGTDITLGAGTAGQVEVVKNVGAGYTFSWHAGAVTTTICSTTAADGTVFRVRVNFSATGAATVTVTPIKNTNPFTQDYVATGAAGSEVGASANSFVAGFFATAADENHGHAVVSNFVTTATTVAGQADMWMMPMDMRLGLDGVNNPLGLDMTMREWSMQYRSGVTTATIPAVLAGGVPEAAWNYSNGRTEYMMGGASPQDRDFGFQATINTLAISPTSTTTRYGIAGYTGAGDSDFLNSAATLAGYNLQVGVFNLVLPPFDGSITTGLIRSAAASVSSPVGSGTDKSAFLSKMRFFQPIVGGTGLSAMGVSRPDFLAADPNAPFAITTLQDDAFAAMATSLRTLGGIVITDNTPPMVKNLNVIQGGVPVSTVLQGPVTFRFRGFDRGLDSPNSNTNYPASINRTDSLGNGSGLARYPRCVLRPINPAGTPRTPAVIAGDIDLSLYVKPSASPNGGNYFEVSLNIGTPTTLITVPPLVTPLVIGVPCGNWEVVSWAEDRVGLESDPQTTASAGVGGGTDGIALFTVVKLNKVTVNVHFGQGWLGSQFDPAHAGTAQVQRWVDITIGGPPAPYNAAALGATNPPVTFHKFVLVGGAGSASGQGNGTIVITGGDLDVNGRPFSSMPCPDTQLWVSLKDPQHSLTRTVKANLGAPASSDYTANMGWDGTALLADAGSFTAIPLPHAGILQPNETGTVGVAVQLNYPLGTQVLLGDVNNSDGVTVTDYGIVASLVGTVYSQNDVTVFGPYPTGLATAHGDMSGNKKVWIEDINIIANDFNSAGDPLAGAYHTSNRPSGGGNSNEDGNRITIAGMLDAGIRDAKRWDFNGDGWVTIEEMNRVAALKAAGKW